jgi:hypothetical protein
LSRNPNAVFYEVQYLREQRLFGLVVPAGLFLIGFFGYAIVKQLILGEPFGDDPMSDRFLAVAGPLYILLGGLLLWLYFGGNLTTEVRPDGLYVRLYPIHRSYRHIGLEVIEKCEVLTYRAIRDFGGWGIRAGRKGRAYNVFGNKGAYLTFKDGKRLLIGSQKAESLVEAILSITR